jgi:predicted DNA-binding transcriptional regulator AlpA
LEKTKMKTQQKLQNAVPVPAAPQGSFQILGVAEVSRMLGVPESSVYEWCRFRASNKGSVIPHRRLGKYLKFIKSEIETWVLQRPLEIRSHKREYHRTQPQTRRKAQKGVAA